MRPDFIEQLQYRLLELGCPARQMKRLADEIADHHEDLKQTALAEGLSETEAEIHANTQLGDPRRLAEHKMTTLRHSSWWGRHFLIGFCVLPLLTVPILWLVFLLVNLALGFAFGYGWDEKKLHAAAENPATFHHMVIELHGADYLATALVALLFCWLARRSMVGLAWMATACAICAFYALFMSAQITRHNFSIGIFSTPHWTRATIPLLIVGTIYFFRQRMIRHSRQKIIAS